MIDPEQQQQLLKLARQAIGWGLSHDGGRMPIDRDRFDAALRQPGACFVTLQHDQQLRGCIGSLEAHQPLIDDVADNAYSAAFRDPRFDPLTQAELANTRISISVLTAPQPMQFTSEADLLSQLQPGIDGLVLKQGMHKGTFLPAVWDQLPQPEQFLNHLKRKAGLDMDAWSNDIQVSRYRTQSFKETA